MPSYLVEAYAPVGDTDQLATAVSHLDPTVVRHVRATFVPDDEMCLHLVEGASLEIVQAALRGAAIPFDRIVEAVE